MPWLDALSRLVVPASLLAVLLGIIYLYSDAELAPSVLPALPGTFTISDFLVPLAVFCIQLTGRRHGPAYALAQLLAALALCAAAALWQPDFVQDWIVTLPALSLRTAFTFALVFLLANGVGIAFFESARGPHWWTAPLAGALAASLLFSILYYPLTGAGLNWTDQVWSHVMQLGGESVGLLIPYWLLRSAIPPLWGLNGY